MYRRIRLDSQLVVPLSVRRQAGMKAGDRVEFKVSGSIITVIPKLPSSDDEYTAARRRVIDARLDEAAKGPHFGLFDTAAEMIAHMKGELKKRATAKKLNRPFK